MKQILIVDDEAPLLDIAQKFLMGEGYEIHTALNPLIALEILNKEKIDLIISDLKMPGMDGLTFCQKVKEEWPQIGFILITGYWMGSRDQIQANQTLLYATLKKPFDFSELIQLTRNYFQGIKSESKY